MSIPHPYGVKPQANTLFADTALLTVRSKGLGRLHILKDEILLELLGFLNGIELSQFEMCSRCTYVFSMTSDLWRDLTLRFTKHSINFVRNWRDTYVTEYINHIVNHTIHHKHKKEVEKVVEDEDIIIINTKTNESIKQHIILPQYIHKPIKIAGVFSDLLHRLWTCHTFDLSSLCPGFFKPPQNINIPRINANDYSINDFVQNYEILNQPVIITNATHNWQSLTKWTPEFLSHECGTQIFRATSATAPEIASFTMKQYFQYMNQIQEEVPLYLFDRDFLKLVPSLQSDFQIPVYFNSKNRPQTDLFRVLGESKRPDYQWLVAGPKRSGSIFHIDPNQTNAWNVSIKGRKKWIFYPPGVCPPGVKASEDGADVIVPLSTGEWLLTFWSHHCEQRRHEDITQRPMEAVAMPGEVMFVPHGWWHMVLNLDDCIAITQNYVSTSNLTDVLRFLREKTDQISGIRDRPDVAVAVDDIYQQFVDNLYRSCCNSNNSDNSTTTTITTNTNTNNNDNINSKNNNNNNNNQNNNNSNNNDNSTNNDNSITTTTTTNNNNNNTNSKIFNDTLELEKYINDSKLSHHHHHHHQGTRGCMHVQKKKKKRKINTVYDSSSSSSELLPTLHSSVLQLKSNHHIINATTADTTNTTNIDDDDDDDDDDRNTIKSSSSSSSSSMAAAPTAAFSFSFSRFD